MTTRPDIIHAFCKANPEYKLSHFEEIEGGPPESGIICCITRVHGRFGKLFIDVIVRDDLLFHSPREKLTTFLKGELERMFNEAVMRGYAAGAPAAIKAIN